MSDFKPYATFSETADAIYVYLCDAGFARTKILDDLRMVDLAADGSVIGVELLHVSGGVDFTDVPERDTVERLIREANIPLPVR
jgi:uncharacterized protein YuzE